MEPTDYLLDHSDLDWPRLLQAWSWLLPPELTVWLVNRFGDLFAILDDGSVWKLDLGLGTFEKLADDRDAFCDEVDRDGKAADWFLVPLVDRLVEAGKILELGHCYGFVIPPVAAEGSYSIGNITPLPVAEVYGWMGSFHERIRDLPDGAKIQVKVV